MSRQCALAGVARSWVYGAVAGAALDELDLLLLGPIHAQYTRRPFYGSRRMVVYLSEQGHAVNRKRVQRLCGSWGWLAWPRGRPPAGPTRNTILPYLLRGVAVVRPRNRSRHRPHLHPPGARLCLPGGHHRLVRPAVLAWRISNTLEAVFRVGLPGGGPAHPRQARVFNTDQVRSSPARPSPVLLREGIAISMDGAVGPGQHLRRAPVAQRQIRGRLPPGYASMAELLLGLTEYFAFYNGERPHQAWVTAPPDAVYHSGKAAGPASWIASASPQPSPAPSCVVSPGVHPRPGGLSPVPADSVWTKRECRKRACAQAGDNALCALPPPCPHSFTLCPHGAAPASAQIEDACGATTTGFFP